MEDKLIKDFDRSIEQMMNQHTVTPPFGAWNRIAAELPTVAPEAAPIAPRIPKSAWIGFLSGASLIATLVAGTLIYNNSTNQPVVSVPTESLVTEKSIVNSVATENSTLNEMPVVSLAPKAEIKSVVNRQQETPLQSETINQSAENVLTDNTNLETATTNTSDKAEQVYFFPAVDINTGKEYDESIVQYAMPSDYHKVTAQSSETEKKVKSNPFKEIRFKPRKDKKRPHIYGRTNRLK
jgi:hypothetical protein